MIVQARCVTCDKKFQFAADSAVRRSTSEYLSQDAPPSSITYFFKCPRCGKIIAAKVRRESR